MKQNHILHYDEWQSNGRWLCGDTSSFVNKSNTWWYIPNLLGISSVDYIMLLKDKFIIFIERREL